MEPSEQTRRKEQEDFRKMLGEMRETFKQSAAELLTEEIVKPAPGEAIALLGKTFGALLDAVAESKRLWHELDARAGGAAERVRQSQMREVLARIRDGEDVDEQAESSRVALDAFEAGHEVIRDGAPAISERFAQRYRPDEMLRVSQRNYTAATIGTASPGCMRRCIPDTRPLSSPLNRPDRSVRSSASSRKKTSEPASCGTLIWPAHSS